MREDPVDQPPPFFHLWPENLPAWQLFHACGTQWRGDMGGRTGLDYDGCEVVMRRRRIPPRQRDRFFALLQVAERGALLGWSEDRARREREPRGKG